MSSLTTIKCGRCLDKGYVFVPDGPDDFEKDHCDCVTGKREEFWNSIAQEDALDCSLSCTKDLYGYHTRGCPLQDMEDRRREVAAEISLDMALGK